MMSIKFLPRLLPIALLLTGLLAFLWAPPAAAHFALNPGPGEAIWFYRSCASPQGSVARWTIAPSPNHSDQRTLLFHIENAYPGYRLDCDIYFANSGSIPFSVSRIQISNAKPQHLTLSAVEVPSVTKGKIKLCGFSPQWGLLPAWVPADCRSMIRVSLTIGDNVAEDTSLPFSVQVLLSQN